MNQISYFEIHAENLERARNFYSGIFDWKFEEQKGLPVEYWRIETNGARGGLLKRMGENPPTGGPVNGFVCSIQVASYDDTHEKLMQKGAIVALPKFVVPGICYQGYYLDTEHNVFGIFEPNTNAK